MEQSARSEEEGQEDVGAKSEGKKGSDMTWRKGVPRGSG